MHKFSVGDRVVIGPESLLEGRYEGTTGVIQETPDTNPAGLYRFKPDKDYPNEPSTWLMFEDELVSL